MGREYRLGFRIVVATVLLSALVGFTFLRATPPRARAGEDLGDRTFPIGPFTLSERSGRTITDADLAGRAWIASFIFTRCPLSCPRISGVMKGLQQQLSASKVQLVSITVDPAFDTPEVLGEYARRYGADPGRWWFLTGAGDAIHELIEKRFKLSVSIPSPGDRQTGAEAVLHSDRLALVDRGHLVGLFDSNDPVAIGRLVAEARRRARPAWISALPPLNAALNGLCAILLLAGWAQIRRRPAAKVRRVEMNQGAGPADVAGADEHVRNHVICMIAAVSTSAVFLCCYLIYHYLAGSVAFRGAGTARSLYFTILISHTILATFGVVPLVTLTLLRAIGGDFVRHASIAKVTFPIWVYVSITGVVIYLMLYQMPVPDASSIS